MRWLHTDVRESTPNHVLADWFLTLATRFMARIATKQPRNINVKRKVNYAAFRNNSAYRKSRLAAWGIKSLARLGKGNGLDIDDVLF